MKALDAACEEVGRDPKTLRRTVMVSCYCAPTEQEVQEGTAKPRRPLGLDMVGTPAQVVEQLQAFQEIGFDYFMIAARDFPHQLTTVELLAHEVLPALNRGC
jgi:alkanesulfonate monooxygenase SsuD/methylene tetrahydromethanopterin reductase-like flavin-dependent oxidoreductase (luciferase family)